MQGTLAGKVADMLDRSKQLSHEEGLRLLECSPGEYLPVVCHPARDRRPDRVVWMNVEGVAFERPFQMEDLLRTEASRTWFVTGWPAGRPQSPQPPHRQPGSPAAR